MRTRYRLTGLLGPTAAIVMLLGGTALAQSMRPGVNFMNDGKTKGCRRRLQIGDGKTSRQEKVDYGKASDQLHRGKANNSQQRCSDAPHNQHARVIAGTSAGRLALAVRTDARYKKMPLLFYFPFIVWMGLMEVAQDEMRVPVRVKTRTPTQR